MKGKTHVAFGGMLGAILALSTCNEFGMGMPVIYGGTVIVGSGLGALVPDIDAEGATITRKLGVLGTTIAKGLKHRGITHTLIGALLFSVCTIAITGLISTLFRGGILGRLLVASLITFIYSCLYSRLKLFRIILKALIEQNAKMTSLISKLIVFIVSIFLAEYLVDFVLVFGIAMSLGYFSHLISDSFNVSGCPWLYPFIDKNYSIGKLRTGVHDNLFLIGSSICTIIILIII